MSEASPVSQTKSWLEKVVIELNFCPFAKKEFVNNTIFYFVSEQRNIKFALMELIKQCHYLQDNPEIETSLLIYSTGFTDFNRFLDFVELANNLLDEYNFTGEFQIATFHPNYCFADVDYDDASNFTNRSPYPMLHLIREASIEKVLAMYKNPETIPEKNITLAQSKGADFFKQILSSIKFLYPVK